MSIKISTLLKKIDLLNSKDNVSVINDIYDYMREEGLFKNYIINNLKVIIEYVNLHSEDKPLK